MQIEIEALCFEAIIGILDFERKTPQRVELNIRLDYHYKEDTFLNYAQVVSLIKERFLLQEYKLLEEALIDLHQFLHHSFAEITSATIKITKPDILQDCRVSLSSTCHFKTPC